MKNLTNMIIGIFVASTVPCFAQTTDRQDTTVYKFVETMPEYPGGIAEMSKFITHNFKYPKGNRYTISGKVLVQFVVNADGRLSDIKPVVKSDEVIDKEICRVVQLMPAWRPGMHLGKFVRVKYVLPMYIEPEN